MSMMPATAAQRMPSQQVNYGENPFHAVSILENGCGRRFGAA
jgi:hypothetical protein